MVIIPLIIWLRVQFVCSKMVCFGWNNHFVDKKNEFTKWSRLFIQKSTPIVSPNVTSIFENG